MNFDEAPLIEDDRKRDTADRGEQEPWNVSVSVTRSDCQSSGQSAISVASTRPGLGSTNGGIAKSARPHASRR